MFGVLVTALSCTSTNSPDGPGAVWGDIEPDTPLIVGGVDLLLEEVAVDDGADAGTRKIRADLNAVEAGSVNDLTLNLLMPAGWMPAGPSACVPSGSPNQLRCVVKEERRTKTTSIEINLVPSGEGSLGEEVIALVSLGSTLSSDWSTSLSSAQRSSRGFASLKLGES